MNLSVYLDVVPTPTWLDPGHTAWQLVAATLVGLMSVPGLAILYSGLMKRKWALNSALMVLCAFGATLIVDDVHPPGDELYLDEPYLWIRWRSVPQILFAEWKGFATSAEMRAALLTGVRAIRERHVVGYVSDARKARVFLPEDEKWATTVWLPQAVDAGLQRMAMVTAQAGLARTIFTDVANPDRPTWSVDADFRLGRDCHGVGAKRTGLASEHEARTELRPAAVEFPASPPRRQRR